MTVHRLEPRRRAKRRHRLALWALAAVGVAALAALGAMCRARPRTTTARSADEDADRPVASRVRGACMAHVAHTGPTTCPYAAATAPAHDGIDWGRPFVAGSARCVAAGSLALPSGRVVATDPLVELEESAFVVRFPRSTGDVILSLSDEDETEDRVAFALLRVGTARPVRWEVARTAGGGDAYGVDAGTGCFVDAATAARVLAREARRLARAADEVSRHISPNDADRWHAEVRRLESATPNLLEVMNAGGFPPALHVNVCVDPRDGANLVAFESGLGDGTYRTYAGYDARGVPVALVTDFQLVDLGVGRHPFLEATSPGSP